jgi:hypothetical protein
VQRPRRDEGDVYDQIAFDECCLIYDDGRYGGPRLIPGERYRMSRTASISVALDNGIYRIVTHDASIGEQEASCAQSPDGREVMAHKKHGSPLTCDVPHPSEAFLLKFDIADREDFVDHKNFRFQMGRDRKSEAGIHSALLRCFN